MNDESRCGGRGALVSATATPERRGVAFPCRSVGTRVDFSRLWTVAFALVAMLGCRKGESERPATIVVSGDTAGWIVPCGCTSNQSGGLPRRGTFVEQCGREGPVVVVDAGGAASDVSTYDRLKFEAILKGELAMGVAAHNLGRAEVELGAEYLRRVQRELNVPFVSANAADAEGELIAEPMRIVEAGGPRVMFVGVCDPQFKTEGVQIGPPRQAISKVLEKAAGKFDRVIVLAYMPEESLRELAENLPEVDAVVGGPTGQPMQPVSVRGYSLLTSATRQGKFLAKLTSPRDDKSAALHGEIVELDGRFADDPRQTENVKAFYSELRRRDLSPRETSFVEDVANWEPIESSSPSAGASARREPRPPGMTRDRNEIAGSAACRACHEEDYLACKKMKHAEAWKVLVEKDAQYNPDCQRCHVTGYGEPGGFETVAGTPKRVNVGCETCHGRSSAHCKKTSVRTQFAEQAKDRCRHCHDRENSPKFDYKTYWEKIQHGKPANEPDQGGGEEE